MRYKGTETPVTTEVKMLLKKHNLKLLDGSALPKMAKVESEESITTTGLQSDWEFFPEKKYKVPTTRRSIRR
jgi:hypothetical protein